MTAPPTTPLGRLLARLDLQHGPDDVFIGHGGTGTGALFGGLVAAQSVIAAGRTVDDGILHSLHTYFLRPGRHGAPIRYAVERVREGQRFTTRGVIATQHDQAICRMIASFVRPEDGIAHQDPMPDAPAPDSLPDWEDLRAELLGDPAQRRTDGPIEVRVCDPDSPVPSRTLPPWRRVWLRPRGSIPADRLLHSAVLVFASDRTLLRTAARPHGLSWRLGVGVSLDHAVWLHRPADFDDWVLYACHSPVAHAARGLVLGAMYGRDGARIATVAQEGLLRAVRPDVSR